MYCTKCNKEKGELDFYKRKSGKREGQYYSSCKDCQIKRGSEYYANNLERDRHKHKARKHRARTLKASLVVISKIGVPCKDCGMVYPPYVMDFDHKDPSTKIDDISHMVSPLNRSVKAIVEEIKKCELVCSNCHRIRTFNANVGQQQRLNEVLEFINKSRKLLNAALA